MDPKSIVLYQGDTFKMFYRSRGKLRCKVIVYTRFLRWAYKIVDMRTAKAILYEKYI
jgi:hypothetical protein